MLHYGRNRYAFARMRSRAVLRDFGHKVTEIKLFQINSADGTLGYVNHSYNPKNIYHKIGNFFIGVAPIIVISAVLYLLAWWLLPGFVAEISGSFNISDFVTDIGNVFTSLFNVLQSFFLVRIVVAVVGVPNRGHFSCLAYDVKQSGY